VTLLSTASPAYIPEVIIDYAENQTFVHNFAVDCASPISYRACTNLDPDAGMTTNPAQLYCCLLKQTAGLLKVDFTAACCMKQCHSCPLQPAQLTTGLTAWAGAAAAAATRRQRKRVLLLLAPLLLASDAIR
jgi:hypothetical protein